MIRPKEEKLEINEAQLITEKMSGFGVSQLTDYQLIAILLGRGEVKESYISKAKIMLERYGSLDEFFANSLFSFTGKEYNLLAVTNEIGRRLKSEICETTIIESSKIAREVAMGLFYNAESEEFWVICLNRSLHVIDKRCLSKGGVDSSIVDVKLLMKHLINNLSSAIIISHNHPSGNLTPSVEDIELTNKIIQAARLFDISLLDHIIVGKNETFSLSENGLINNKI